MFAAEALLDGSIQRKISTTTKVSNFADVCYLLCCVRVTTSSYAPALTSYLSELPQRHAERLAGQPAEWMPWNYRPKLQRTAAGRVLRRLSLLPYDESAWPETILFGNSGAALENGRKPGLGKDEIAEGF